jgi:hypothetical protein
MSAGLSPQQEKWFASVRAGIERDTGRPIEDWVKIAKTCPETKHRARLAWFKAEHGLGINRASTIIELAFPTEGTRWDQPDALVDALWRDEAQRAIHDALVAHVGALPEVTVGERKTYTAFSRKHQFVSARPVKGGVRIGLAVAPEADAMLEPAKKNEGWSERLKSSCMVAFAKDITPTLKRLIAAAHATS